jgi:hypothetical protein
MTLLPKALSKGNLCCRNQYPSLRWSLTRSCCSRSSFCSISAKSSARIASSTGARLSKKSFASADSRPIATTWVRNSRLCFSILVMAALVIAAIDVVATRRNSARRDASAFSPRPCRDNALKNAGRAADEVAEKLAQSCPKGVPAEPSARLDAVEHGIDAVRAALSTLEPPVQAFYESLKDDQKARLIARYVAAGSSGGQVAETTGSGSRAAATGARRRMRFFIDDVPSPTAQMWNCEQWQAELRAWPIARVEQVIAVAARQRAAFYDLAASIQRAADMLADSCPREATPTPIGRIEELRKKLDAVRESFTAIEPALDRFYDVLDAGQRARFSDAI